MEINKLTQNSFGHKIKLFTQLPNLKCAMCNNSLLRTSDVDNFVRSVCGQNASMSSSKSILNYLDTMCYQNTRKAELLTLMKNYAAQYPDKSFGEIFNMPEIFSYHLDRAHSYFAQSYEKSRPIFELMEKNLKLTPEQKQKMAEFHKKAINISIGNYSDNVKRYLIMQNYAGLQNEIGGTASATIIKYAKKIPLSPGSPDLLLCHMAGKSDAHIMQGFLSGVTPTRKKIDPHVGHSIFICQNCATEAGFVPFKSLFYLFPNMFKNIQEQLNTIITALANGHLKGHADYPVVLKKLISAATNGEKVLNLDLYSQNRRAILNNVVPVSPSEMASRLVSKKKRYETILLRENPETVKTFLITAERNKKRMIQSGASEEQIKHCNDYIVLLRKIYIQLLKRDGVL